MKGISVTEKAATTVATAVSTVITTTTTNIAVVTDVTMKDTQGKSSFIVRKRVKIIDFEKKLKEKANMIQ